MKGPCFVIVAILTIVIVIFIVIRPPWGSSEKGITIVLNTSASPQINPRRPELRRSTGVDHVRWVNETGQQIVVEIEDWQTRWLFMEPAVAQIVIPAGSRTQWFTLAPGANGPMDYRTVPELDDDAPDEPVISAGD